MDTTKTEIDRLIGQLPDERLVQLLAFAQFLAEQEERREWLRFGQQRMAAAYSDDEPEYTLNDIKKSKS